MTHPLKVLSQEGERALREVRAICLALPGTTEQLAWGTPTFRVSGRMFGHFNDDHHGDGRIAVWCAAPPGLQSALIDASPVRFFRPPYVGARGWVGIDLSEDVDWDEVATVLLEGWRHVAPARLLSEVGRTG